MWEDLALYQAWFSLKADFKGFSKICMLSNKSWTVFELWSFLWRQVTFWPTKIGQWRVNGCLRTAGNWQVERGRERGKENWKWSFGRNGKNRKRPSRESNPGPQQTDKISNKLAGDVACLGGSMVEHQPRLLGSRVRFPAGAFAIFSVSAKASLPIFLPPFHSSFFLFLFISFPLPFPSTFRLRFKISLFALIPSTSRRVRFSGFWSATTNRQVCVCLPDDWLSLTKTQSGKLLDVSVAWGLSAAVLGIDSLRI